MVLEAGLLSETASQSRADSCHGTYSREDQTGPTTQEEMVLDDAGAANSVPANVSPGTEHHTAAERAAELEMATAIGRVESPTAPALALQAGAASAHVKLPATCDCQTNATSMVTTAQTQISNMPTGTPTNPAVAFDNQATTPGGDPTPTASEAARLLAKFANDVQKKRPTPLIKSPPKQRPPAKKAPIPTRSRRIAAQQLGHIPVSKRGEVIAMKRLGFTHPSAQPSSGQRRDYDAFFNREMTDQEVEALDNLFQANKTRAGKTTRRPLAAVA